MEKKPFARIEYTNCSPDYESTICELNDIDSQIECFKQDVEDLDEAGYNDWKAKGYLPEIRITVIMLTDDEYAKWFVKNVKP